MASGSRPKPIAVKMAQGTFRPDRAAQDAPTGTVDFMPEPPPMLNARQADIFREVAAFCSGMKVLALEDTCMLYLLAIRLWEVEYFQEQLESDGYTYETKNKEGEVMIRAHPHAGMKNEAMRDARALLTEFGLSPAARGKVSAGKSEEQNPFATLEHNEANPTRIPRRVAVSGDDT